ncbi:MAG: translocation/assembly module TamB [Tannerellaceae bacterium]|nr:translocation/assembly module TamB [Tannerellaceae bacterium]
MPVILLNIPFIQRKVAGIAVTELSNRLNVPVRIGKVDIEWFNRLVLDGLYLEDEAGNTLFEANHVTAGFKPFPLLKGKFVFTTVRLLGFSLHLNKNTPGDKLNLQFVIDAFASRDSTKQSPAIDLQFNSILIRKGNFTYDVLSEPATPGKFNAKHVDIKDISAKITLKAFNEDSLNATIKKMSFTEASGFDLEKLSLNIVGNRDSAFVQNFQVKLPKTDLKIDRANIRLTEVTDGESFLDKAPVTLDIAPSHIYLKELSCFVPAFGNFVDYVELSAEASGFINDIALKRLTLTYMEKMLFIGKMSLTGITHPEEAYLLGEVNKMYITNEGLTGLLNNFSKDTVILPEPVHRLGTINFTGEISGFFDNLVAYGKLSSAIGSVETDVLFGSNPDKNIAAYVRGTISTSELLISDLFEEDNPYGIARFKVSIDAKRPVGGYFAGNVKAEASEFDYKNYRYENLQLSGNFQRNGYDGIISIDDPNGSLYAEGMFRTKGKNSIFNFTADLAHFRPDNLNLTDTYESPEISASLKADFTGDNIDNVEGSITLDSLTIRTAPSDFFLKQLRVEASGASDNKLLTISSDVVTGEVKGVYSFSTLLPSLFRTLNGYLPALIETTTQRQEIKANNFRFHLSLENTEALSNTLKLPFTVLSKGSVAGEYNNLHNTFRMEMLLPQFRLSGMMFDSFALKCENLSDLIDLQVNVANYNKKGLRNDLRLQANAQDNKITASLDWVNNKERRFESSLTASAFFIQDENENGRKSLRTEIGIDEGSLIINDRIWHIEQAGITAINNRIDISNFYVSHDTQYIRVDGTVSKDPQDVVVLDLNDIELSYIFDIINNPVLQFGGLATGIFNISGLYTTPVLKTDNFEVERFSFNQVGLGRLHLHSEWDDAQQGIAMKGSIYANDTTYTDVNGYIFPVGAKSGLSLQFGAHGINVAFLYPFMDNIATSIKGRGWGDIRLHGPFKELNVEGRAFVEDGGIGIGVLNTYYTFSDSVIMDDRSLRIDNAAMYDRFGNSGTVNLTLHHKHFKEMDYLVDISAYNMLVYDATQKHNPLLYGAVFGSGEARITGNEQIVNLDINMANAPKTAVSLDFMSRSSAEEYNFITFVSKDSLLHPGAGSTKKEPLYNPLALTDEGAEVRINLNLDVNPDASIELIMDPTSGDKIKGVGSGRLQIDYGTKSDLRMYGTFRILQGDYNFSLQQLIHKNFKIRDGSTVHFNGNPFDATINIDATYSLTANIGDLDQSLLLESARTNIPVNCVLKLDGMLQNPAISFDIELPGSNEDLERQVKSYVNTEDMMTRQIVYLLVLNKFYTEDIYRTGRTNEFSAVTSAAISSQISNILSTITDKVQIGTNIRASQEGFNETEFEMLLSSQLLDNRLIFNGNFGYKSNPNVKNVFVGEFDIEYLLTRTGEIRLKAYNHANDMYRYLKQSLTTQGIGIMYKKDFSSFSELFRRRRRPLIVAPAGIPPVLPD